MSAEAGELPAVRVGISQPATAPRG